MEEVTQVITWLTGYTAEEIEKAAAGSVTYGDFFRNAPHLNPNRKLITGVICGVRVETIEEPLMQEIRYLDKPEFADLFYAYGVLDSGRFIGESSHLVGLGSNQASFYLRA